MQAMLLCCGEIGYQRVAVKNVYKRYGGSRAQFYRLFSSKADCFNAAYREESERICRRLLSFTEGPGDRVERLEAALRDLDEFVTGNPDVARSLFVEVHVAGGAALTKRREIFERLARAVDSACRTRGTSEPPPLSSGEFIVGAIEEAIANSLVMGTPEELRSAIPELAGILLRIYAPH